MKLLLDEMYPPALAAALRRHGIETHTAGELGLTGHADADLFATAVAGGYVLLTENVSDFTRLAGNRVAAGQDHPGVLIALSSRFSRRPSGVPALAAAVHDLADEQLDSRVVFLPPTPPPP